MWWLDLLGALFPLLALSAFFAHTAQRYGADTRIPERWSRLAATLAMVGSGLCGLAHVSWLDDALVLLGCLVTLVSMERPHPVSQSIGWLLTFWPQANWGMLLAGVVFYCLEPEHTAPFVSKRRVTVFSFQYLAWTYACLDRAGH